MTLRTLVFASAILLGATAQAKNLVCDYSAFSMSATKENSQQFSMPIDERVGGAAAPLELANFGDLKAVAWTLGGDVIVEAKDDAMRFSSTDTGKANLRLEIKDEVYEAVCRIN